MRSHALPAAVDAGTGVLPDTLLVLLVTTTLALWAARTPSPGTTSPVAAAVTGAVGALASLAHPVGIGFLALAVALLVLAPHWTPTAWPAARPLATATAVALAAVLQLAQVIEDRAGRRVLIYRLVGGSA